MCPFCGLVEQAIRSAKKSSVASSWHFISTCLLISFVCLDGKLSSTSRRRSCLCPVMARLRSGNNGAGVQFQSGGRDFNFFKAFGLAVGPIKFRI